MLDHDYLEKGYAKNARETKLIGKGEKQDERRKSWDKNQDEKRRSVQDLFRNRLKINIGVEKL